MRAPRLVLAVASAACQLAHPATGAVNGGYAEVVRQAAPSVVTVLVEEHGESAGQRAVERATGDTQYNDMRTFILRMLSGPGNPVPGKGGSALGSGFVIRADGLIVTNRHVVEGARTVRVKLADDRVIPAQVLGTDATTDIALLRVRAGPLPALRLESSDKVSVGDPVIAIGNPFGLGQTVTAGVLSARARVLEQDPYIDFLQTDAAINFGNSGGPLLSTDGTVVGVTSTILSPSGGSVGLGFAIPAETVASVVTELEAHGRVSRGYLGHHSASDDPRAGAGPYRAGLRCGCAHHGCGTARTLCRDAAGRRRGAEHRFHACHLRHSGKGRGATDTRHEGGCIRGASRC